VGPWWASGDWKTDLRFRPTAKGSAEMAAILSYLEDTTVFEPDALRSMSQAFDEVCNALQVFAGDEHGRQVVAVRLIELARAGVTDARTLRERILREARTAA